MPESIHVIPCDESGKMLEGHCQDELCDCEPSIELAKCGSGRYIVIHNMWN